MSRDPVVLGATLSLAAFAALSFYDGVVVHFFVERLPFRPASRLEHRLHTARALLFPAILLTFFAGRGPIAVGWGLLAIDQVLEAWDMAIERRSREHTAGLPSSEYLAHGALTMLRTAAIVFTAMIDRSQASAAMLDTLVSALVPGAVLAGAAHLGLATEVGRARLSSWRRAA